MGGQERKKRSVTFVPFLITPCPEEKFGWAADNASISIASCACIFALSRRIERINRMVNS